MKKLISYLALIICVLNTKAQTTPILAWAKLLSASNGSAGINATSINVDGSGNVLTSGTFIQTPDFDPNIGNYTLSAINSTDVYISKLDVNGNFVWAKQFIGSGGLSFCGGITTDAIGNVYTTGSFAGNVDFDPSSGVNTFSTSAPNIPNVFISKLDAAGNFMWAKQFETNDTGEGYSIKVDNSGNVYCAGYFTGTVDFDPNAGVFNLSTTASAAFVVKLDALGNLLWAKQFESNVTSANYSMQLDFLNNIVLCGYFSGTVDFDPSVGVTNLTGGNSFICKLDNTGNLLWVKQFTNSSFYPISGNVTTDASGNVYATGGFTNTEDFDPNIGTYNITSSGNLDGFILKLNAAGNFIWAKQFSGTDFGWGNNIGIDIVGDVYVSGNFVTSIDLNSSAGSYTIANSPSGCNGLFVTKFDELGNFKWGTQLGSYGGSEQIVSIAVDVNKNVYTTAGWVCDGDFDPGPATYTLTSNYDNGAFVHKMSQALQTEVENNLIIEDQVTIYPNPNNGSFTIETTNNTTKLFQIFNVTGALVFKKNSEGTKNTIDTGDLEAGVYTIKLSNELCSLTKKLVIVN